MLKRAARHDADAKARFDRKADVTTMPQMVLGRHIRFKRFDGGSLYLRRENLEGGVLAWSNPPMVRITYPGEIALGHQFLGFHSLEQRRGKG